MSAFARRARANAALAPKLATGSALAALQREFMRLLTGEPGDFPRELDASQGIPPDTGLGVYTHAYGARLREALAGDHAALVGCLGADGWDELGAAYIAACPSRHRSLRSFGNALPAFLRDDPRYRGRPALASLAQFERALLDSFDAADDATAEWDQLLRLPAARWPSLRLRLQRGLGRFEDAHGSVETWLASKAGQPTLLSDLPRPAQSWAIWRDAQLITHFRSLEPAEAALLDHFRFGGNFAEGCERLAPFLPADAVPAQALRWLGQWCADGWIAAWLDETDSLPDTHLE